MSSLLARLGRLSAPTFRIRVNGLPSSGTLNERLTAIRIVLNNGEVSDQLSLELDDRATLFGADIQLPSQGAVLSVALGYEGYQAEMGDYVVNQVRLSGSSGGKTISITATPALLNSDVTRTWTEKTLGEIIADIAKEHDLTAKISPALKLQRLAVLNQLNESNGAFLTRLAARYNAVCKPMAGNLLFMAKGEGSSASGLPMLPVILPAQDVISWGKSLSEQQDYTKICSYWYDYQQAAEQTVYVPPGEPGPGESVLRLPHLYNNEAEALAAADARFNEVNRADESMDLTLIGNPDITAEGKILVQNLRSGCDGSYIVKQVTHSFSAGGYQTQLQAYVEPGVR